MAFIPDYEGKEKIGMILRIERSSVHDGDGYRTVVFFKGCPLRCVWCSTPESQSFEVEQTAEKCYGTVMTVEQVLKEVRKDIPFYFHSGGGMTLSGGEVLAQAEFAAAILQEARFEGIHTAIETSLFAPWEAAEPVLRSTDLVFADMKAGSSAVHEKFCGAGNALILDNLRRTDELEEDFRLVVRVPVIPGVNDAPEELEAIGRFCAERKKLEAVQLLPYHRLGIATYAKLGRKYALPEIQAPSAEYMEEKRAQLRHFPFEIR